MTDKIDVGLTPAFLIFEDSQGREWQALVLVAPLKNPDLGPVVIADTKDLELRFKKLKLVRRN